jgi:hypothetical protein
MTEPKTEPTAEVSELEFLVNENNALRRAGWDLAEAALYVAREHDGVHRLLLAVSQWTRTLADEGGRGQREAAKLQEVALGEWQVVPPYQSPTSAVKGTR